MQATPWRTLKIRVSDVGPNRLFVDAYRRTGIPRAQRLRLESDAKRSRWCENGVFALKEGEDQAIGRSRGGLTTRIHAIVDALGNPVALSLTPGQAADITQAAALLDQVEPEAFLADKGYDSDALIQTLEERDITPVIPSKANRRQARKTDFALYRERNLVERFFNKLKQYRALATRYDKLANTFLAAVALVCVLFWLN